MSDATKTAPPPATAEAASKAATSDPTKAPDNPASNIPRNPISMRNPAFDGVGGAQFERVFIAISGMIGAGKSTLAKALGEVLDLPVYYEPVMDNEYLADYYKDMKKYAFPLQIYLLNRRFKQQQQIIWAGKGGVQDRTIYEDAVFARMLCKAGHMEQRDYETYLSLFNNMANFMKRPNIIVHLDVTPEESLRRINLRSRDCESNVSIGFLRALHEAYEEFIEDVARAIPVIKVSYEEFQTAEAMAARIKTEYENIANIRHVAFPPKSPKQPAAANSSKPVDKNT